MTLCAAFQETAAAAADPGRVALRASDGAIALTWAEAAGQVERIAGALASLGVGRGDTVALLLANRPEFNLIDTAAMHLGAVPWSIYATSSADQIADLVTRAGSRVVITEEAHAERVASAVEGGAVEHLLRIDELSAWPAPPPGFDFGACWRAVGPDDVLTIIWTSGTTGPSKGVELTHRAMRATLDALLQVTGLRPGGRAVSYLPAAHVADRWAAHYLWMLLGTELTCLPDPGQLIATLADVRPTFWGSVPRVFEKLEASLRSSGVDPAAMTDAQRAAVRAQLGLDAAEFLVVGAAPLAVETHAFFTELGLPLCEVWGMSETCGLLTVTPASRRKLGSVGPPLPGVSLRVADDGEVLARGPMLMRGYRGDPDRTAEAIDGDGWLHTGDIGEIDDDGYLTIVDRKKELIINAAGKNMSPLAIEAALKGAGPLVGQACVIGDRRPYNIALLVLDPDAAAGIDGARPYADLVHDPGVRDAVAAEVHAANARLSRVEQIKRWRLLPADWPADGDELTPTMKLKRRVIAEKYAAEIEELYGP